LSSEESKNKRKRTNLKKYGTQTPAQNDQIKNKILQTKKDKYGDSNFNNRSKAKKTCLEKYGSEHYLKSDHFKSTLPHHDVFTKEFLQKEHHENKKSFSQIGKETGFSNCTVGRHSKKQNVETKWFYHSTGQREVYDYIKSLNIDCIENYRHTQHREIDVYIPDLNLGIEYNGLYWHSFNKKELSEERNKHKEKSLYFKNSGIKILQIFENEWLDPQKQLIWKSIIRNKLNIIQNKIFARKCIIKNVSTEDERNFLNDYHIQGYVSSSHCFGLYFNDELISLLSFGAPRFNKKSGFEILRYCTKFDHQVVGGFSKLLKHFIKLDPSHQNLITYSDIRYSFGNVYESCGFTKSKVTEPNYFYFHNNNKEIISRYRSQKQRLSRLLNNYNEKLTESQNMFNHGYRRVWDCGNILFEYKGIV
jgi:hypothetical protein